MACERVGNAIVCSRGGSAKLGKCQVCYLVEASRLCDGPLAGWPMPTALSPATKHCNGAGDSCNMRAIRLLVSGWPLNGFCVTTGKPAQLNPEHSRWLMGYPIVWSGCAVTAMQSFQKRARRSSKPTCPSPSPQQERREP